MPFFVAAVVFSLDRFTKIAALRFLDVGRSIKAIPGVLGITLVLNDGAAFGLFKGRSVFFIFISVSFMISLAFISSPSPLYGCTDLFAHYDSLDISGLLHSLSDQRPPPAVLCFHGRSHLISNSMRKIFQDIGIRDALLLIIVALGAGGQERFTCLSRARSIQ